jgi:hypothetical protein
MMERDKYKHLFRLLFSFYFHLLTQTHTHTAHLLSFAGIDMPTSKYLHATAKSLPLNIMNLRDEAFYDFIRQFSGKRVAELLAFQKCNGIDSFLECKDVTAVLHLHSDQLIDLKKATCITLSDGSIVLLPGLESSISNLTKLL